MKSLKSLYQLIDQFSFCGYRKATNGALLSGNIKFYGEEYYHVILYPPNLKTVSYLEELYSISLPNDIKGIYQKYNGFHLFDGLISIFGFVSFRSRSGDDSYQPWDIQDYNTFQKNDYLKDDDVVLGISTASDYSFIIWSSLKNRIFLINKKTGSEISSWDSLDEMLTSEISRITSLLNDKGEFDDLSTASAATQVFVEMRDGKLKEN